MSHPKLAVRLLGAAATVLLASACGSTPSTPAGPGATGATGAAPSPINAAASGGVLGVHTTSLGPVLVDAKGMTVYLLTADTPGHSSCSGACLQYWPLVPAPAGAEVKAVKGINAPLGQAKAANGASMLTAGGWPLYTFVKDSAPGDVTGQGVKTFGGTWYAVSPSGAAVTGSAASSPTSSGGTRGGYG
ncbi:MAG: hypothetical protein ABI438_07885 [Dermatophilaceae bacterium]